jgi:hypothetical protein
MESPPPPRVRSAAAAAGLSTLALPAPCFASARSSDADDDDDDDVLPKWVLTKMQAGGGAFEARHAEYARRRVAGVQETQTQGSSEGSSVPSAVRDFLGMLDDDEGFDFDSQAVP